MSDYEKAVSVGTKFIGDWETPEQAVRSILDSAHSRGLIFYADEFEVWDEFTDIGPVYVRMVPS